MEERLFSTGNEDLDLILEEVYYSGLEDGYDYFQKEFADKKKPKGLRKYKDYDGSKMTKAQQRAAIEEEDETAEYNTGRYRSKYGWKGAGHGAGTGAGIGAGVGLWLNKGGDVRSKALGAAGGAALGAVHGGLLGGGIGVAVGESKANKDGHNRDQRSIKLARKFDEANAKRGIDSELEYQHQRDIRDRRREELDAQRNYYMSQMAYNSWR